VRRTTEGCRLSRTTSQKVPKIRSLRQVRITSVRLGFVMLVKGADLFVDGSAGIATKFKIPQLIIGLTIVAMGTSAPEAAVSITAAIKGNADITVGNIVGSNIFNILFVIGISAAIIPVPFASGFRFDTVVAIIASLILWVCPLKDMKLKRWAGILMLAAYAVYFAMIW